MNSLNSIVTAASVSEAADGAGRNTMEPKGSTGLLARMTLSDSFRLLITLNFYLLFVNYGYRAYLQGLKWTVGKDDIRKAVEFLKVTCVKSWMKGTGIMNCIDLEVHLTGIKSLFTFRIRIRLYDFLDKKPKFFGGKEMVIRNWMIDTFILSPNTACFGRKVNSF